MKNISISINHQKNTTHHAREEHAVLKENHGYDALFLLWFFYDLLTQSYVIVRNLYFAGNFSLYTELLSLKKRYISKTHQKKGVWFLQLPLCNTYINYTQLDLPDALLTPL